jgi:hypothetical protein
MAIMKAALINGVKMAISYRPAESWPVNSMAIRESLEGVIGAANRYH